MTCIRSAAVQVDVAVGANLAREAALDNPLSIVQGQVEDGKFIIQESLLNTPKNLATSAVGSQSQSEPLFRELVLGVQVSDEVGRNRLICKANDAIMLKGSLGEVIGRGHLLDVAEGLVVSDKAGNKGTVAVFVGADISVAAAIGLGGYIVIGAILMEIE